MRYGVGGAGFFGVHLLTLQSGIKNVKAGAIASKFLG